MKNQVRIRPDDEIRPDDKIIFPGFLINHYLKALNTVPSNINVEQETTTQVLKKFYSFIYYCF